MMSDDMLSQEEIEALLRGEPIEDEDLMSRPPMSINDGRLFG